MANENALNGISCLIETYKFSQNRTFWVDSYFLKALLYEKRSEISPFLRRNLGFSPFKYSGGSY